MATSDGLVDKNAPQGRTSTGTKTETGTTAGTTSQQQTTGGSQISSSSSAVQNMTPQALAALEGLIQQLSTHPAVSDAAATLQLQASGLRPPSFSRNMGFMPADANGQSASRESYTDEMGRPIYTAAEYQAAQARYATAKSNIVAAGGMVEGGTAETRAAQLMHDSLVKSLSAEHAANVAATAAANTKNAEQQAAIFKAYGDNVTKAAATYDANKSIVENANAVNKTQNDAAFQVYLKNTVTADADHQRAILQNAEDRAIAQQNLLRSQGLQTQSLAENRAISQAYSKEAAFNDARTLTAGFARKLAEQIMPTILRATEASGTSGSATTALLANDAAARTAEAAASTGLTTAANYGQIQSSLAGINANLINNSAQLQQTAPVAGIQQIATVAPLNPGLIQNAQQVQAPNPQGVLMPNDQTTAALTELTTRGANPTLDALLASLGIAKGATQTSSQVGTQASSNTQTNQGQTSTMKTDKATQTGVVIPNLTFNNVTTATSSQKTLEDFLASYGLTPKVV